MKREGDLRYDARPPEPPVQARPLHHPAKAVAEPVDGVDDREQKKRYKTRVLPSTVSKTMCGRCRSGMAPRRKRKRTTTRRRSPAKRRRGQVWGVGPGLPIGILKAGYEITKAIGDHQTKRAIAIADKRTQEWESGKRKRYAGESFNCCLL